MSLQTMLKAAAAVAIMSGLGSTQAAISVNPGKSLMLTATDSTGSVSQTLVGATRFSFLGFVSDGMLTSLTITAVQPDRGGVFPTVNNLVLATAIPEPQSYVLLLAGLAAGLLVVSRRRNME